MSFLNCDFLTNIFQNVQIARCICPKMQNVFVPISKYICYKVARHWAGPESWNDWQRRLSDPVCFIDFLSFVAYLFHIFLIFVSYFPHIWFMLVWNLFLSLSRMSCLSYLETFLLSGPTTDRESETSKASSWKGWKGTVAKKRAEAKKGSRNLWRACGNIEFLAIAKIRVLKHVDIKIKIKRIKSKKLNLTGSFDKG